MTKSFTMKLENIEIEARSHLIMKKAQTAFLSIRITTTAEPG